MKKVSLRVRSFEKECFLTYNIDNEASLDEELLDFIEDDEPKGIVPVIFEEGDEFDTFSYNVTDKIHLSELSMQEVNAEIVLRVLRSLVLTLIDMAEYRIPLSYLVLHRDYIYVDSDYRIEFICIPLEDMQEEVDVSSFLRGYLANIRYDLSENCEYVAKLLTYVNNTAMFNMRNLVTFVQELLDDMGIEIPEEDAAEIYVDYQEVIDEAEELETVGDREDAIDQMVEEKPADEAVEDEIIQDEEITAEESEIEEEESDAEPVEEWEDTLSGEEAGQAEEDNSQEEAFEADFEEDIDATVLSEEEDVPDEPAISDEEDILQETVIPDEEDEFLEDDVEEDESGETETEEFEVEEPEETENEELEAEESEEDSSAEEEKEKVIKKPIFKTKEASVTGVVIEDELGEFLAEKEREDQLAQHEETGLKIKKSIKVNRASIVKNTQEELKAEEEEAKAEDVKEGEAEEKEEETTGTSILSQALGSTGILKNNSAPKVNPYLIRTNTKERIMITKQNFKIGKATMGVDYTVKGNGAVSRTHAIITNKDGDYYIKDNKSTNHTYVNNKMVADGEGELLTHDCKIVLGDEEFTFKLR
ncbi:MAG: FHA domain-containing protein [Lachnospiraceae bacterium]|nr:FHA domain-containing protein [Lachnospiraceae bacterium]